MKPRTQLLVLVGMLLALAGALLYLRIAHKVVPPASTQTFSDAANGIRFVYPASYRPTAVSDELTKNGTFFRAADPTPAVLTVRREASLGILRSRGGTILGELTSNADRQLPQRFKDYQQQTLADRTVGAYPAKLIEFTYTGTDGQTLIRQLQAIVVVRDTDGYFFILQAPDADFDAYRAEFLSLLESVTFTQPTTADSAPQ